jgi:hypothetical protein
MADEQTSLSLLDREDLRNNVIVLSTDLRDANLMEHLFKSDGLLLGVSFVNNECLLAVEQTETHLRKFQVNVYWLVKF